MVAEEPSKVIRQFSLIHAMLASRFGLTIDEILGTVDGYRDTFDPYSEKSLAAVTKSFERDKKDIRDLGIVIQTRSPADASNDNHGVRYLIDPATYVLPPDVEFSRSEIALLQLAARAWQHGSMNKEALRALNKLRSLGIEPDSSLTGVRPRISGWNGAVNEFGEILSENGIAEFDYLKAYSPLHNAKPAKYPATLVMTADHDDRVVPAHSFKFAAAMQAAQAGDAPVLIRVDVKAGHGAGKPTAKVIEESADRWSFLMATLGVTPPPPL
jgi:hypothetical protein